MLPQQVANESIAAANLLDDFAFVGITKKPEIVPGNGTIGAQQQTQDDVLQRHNPTANRKIVTIQGGGVVWREPKEQSTTLKPV